MGEQTRGKPADIRSPAKKQGGEGGEGGTKRILTPARLLHNTYLLGKILKITLTEVFV